MEKLYEKCPHCRGARQVMSDRAEARVCPLCDGEEYVVTGLTTGQVERMVRLERAIAGDPGIPAAERADLLRAHAERVAAALAAVRREL